MLGSSDMERLLDCRHALRAMVPRFQPALGNGGAIAYVVGMKHGAISAKPVADMSEDEFTEWLSALPPAPGIRHIDDDDEEDDARSDADIAAGRGIPHERVAEWLRTVGTPDYRPMPREWLE